MTRRSMLHGALRMHHSLWLIITLIFAFAASQSNALLQQDEYKPQHEPQYAYPYNFECFDRKEQKTVKYDNIEQPHIGLQVSERVTDQLITRIFAIFLREKLNYKNVSLVPLREKGLSRNELSRLKQTMKFIDYHSELLHLTMINLAVWMPAMGHIAIPKTVYQIGSLLPPGRFGWFVPEPLLKQPRKQSDFLSYQIFLQPTSSLYAEYIIDDNILEKLQKLQGVEQFVSNQCRVQKCVTLLAAHQEDTDFIKHEIQGMHYHVNVLWLGAHLKIQLKQLIELYKNETRYENKKFLVLHWSPSEVINDNIIFKQIAMPKCEEAAEMQMSLCKYELTPILKYSSVYPDSEVDNSLSYALNTFNFTIDDLQLLFEELRKQRSNDSSIDINHLYDRVACQWLHTAGNNTYRNWLNQDTVAPTLFIGGIFPITQTNRGHQNLVRAVQSAKRAINLNQTILNNYNLEVLENDGQCKADLVLKAFINYFNLPNVLLGVLGPACSETVEPIAGISKHARMAVISYSAEGATFMDRKAYPFFFRTIGSNRQYEDAYIQLMKHMSWHRVAALSEDGQKYTEYISHMEATMKLHNLELIINKKFLSDVTAAQMNKHLLDLKKRRAKIIIADIGNKNTILALCEAFKLGMTAYQGYIWFLPSWLSKNLQNLNSTNNRCSQQELEMAFDGHFTIMHTPFGDANAIMQENKTIKEWFDSYNVRNLSNISNYAGFAYDAVWAYALATDKLLQEDKDAISNMRSEQVVKRFVELLWQTDFQGLSGRVRFGQGGSRITDLNIMQWQKTKFVDVGKFYVEVVGNKSSLRTNGGKLVMKDTAIIWLSGAQTPGDGTYDCNFAALAELLGTNCDSASMVFIALLCLTAVVLVSIISFFFWKKRYDNKLKQSAKIMKNFGIDLLSPSRGKSNTLDKWEIPKENVVINRRLGEGAFGTVYGGEALLTATDCWRAVAVKTLKAGASMEDRLDFLSEAEAMKRFDHKNIVKLLGVCLQSEPIYTVMEFMLYGDLKTYLLARRHLVHEKVSDDSDISSKRLTMYAMDVARGLSYLAQQKYVHRDVACRNCLVNAERVVKLGDFGMSRPTYESDYYRFNRKGMLPVRWMAPESLALGMFTPASDVWAFGVVLYEIITFGSFPYQGLTNNQALEFIKSGKTLQVPIGAKPQLEALIKACWSQEVKKRPAAKEIVEYILNYSRLLTPCLDFPGASVEMPESDSDQLELLPKLRKCSPHKKDSTLDILAQTSGATDECYNQMDLNGEATESDTITAAAAASFQNNSSASIMIPRNSNCSNQQQDNSYAATTPDGYSIMSPLLMHQVSESSDTSQAMLLRKPSSEKLQQTKL